MPPAASDAESQFNYEKAPVHPYHCRTHRFSPDGVRSPGGTRRSSRRRQTSREGGEKEAQEEEGEETGRQTAQSGQEKSRGLSGGFRRLASLATGWRQFEWQGCRACGVPARVQRAELLPI